MPFNYDYGCENGHTWEERRCARDINAPATCPTCGKDGIALFSPRGVMVAIPRRFLNGVTKAEVME